MDKIIYNHDGRILKTIDKNKNNGSSVNIINHINDNWGIYISLISICILISSGIRNIQIYQFYGISYSFFTFNIYDMFIPIFRIVILLMLYAIAPYILYKLKDKILKNLMKVLFYLYTLALFLDLDITNTKAIFINMNDNILFWFLFIILLFHYFVLFPVVWNMHKYKNNDKKEYRKIKIYISKIKYLIKIIILTILLFLDIILMFSLIEISLNTLLGDDITNRKSYAVTNINNDEKIILFISNDRTFIADYNLNNNGDLIVYTKSYEVLSMDSFEVTNIKSNNITIEKNMDKPK
jgi:hypothetical protein